MRNPSKRIHVNLGIGRRDAPQPPAAWDLQARFGYAIGNHVREGRSHAASGLPSLYVPERTAQRLKSSLVRLDARAGEGFPCSAPEPEDSPLLLAQSQVRALQAANRRKDEFLALLAHELRSPLCAIGYAAGLLGKDANDSGPQLPWQALIQRQVLRMTHLVDEVLDVSRVTNGLLNLQSERVDLRVIVGNAIETLQSSIDERNQRLNNHMPGAPVWVMGDERRLEQVFVNLIANASRYTDKGGRLTTWMYLEGTEAVVRIRDSGIGIAPESLPGLFELFRQANAADPRSRAGLGVGLALVRQLIELHGGAVTAASEGIGRGSEFTISLPILGEWLPAKIAAHAA